MNRFKEQQMPGLWLEEKDDENMDCWIFLEEALAGVSDIWTANPLNLMDRLCTFIHLFELRDEALELLNVLEE